MRKNLLRVFSGLVVLFSFGTAPAGAVPIEEISVDSVDTVFDYAAGPVTDSQLTIEQSGLTIVVEKPGNVQEEVSGAFFSLVTNLAADNSTGGRAIGSFAGGTITIKDAMGVPLLLGDISSFNMEEDTYLPLCVLAAAGSFHVTGGTWQSSFLPEGIILDLTWKLDSDIDDFGADFDAESDVTLTPIPEPTVVSLLVVGGLMILRRRWL